MYASDKKRPNESKKQKCITKQRSAQSCITKNAPEFPVATDVNYPPRGSTASPPPHQASPSANSPRRRSQVHGSLVLAEHDRDGLSSELGTIACSQPLSGEPVNRKPGREALFAAAQARARRSTCRMPGTAGQPCPPDFGQRPRRPDERIFLLSSNNTRPSLSVYTL